MDKLFNLSLSYGRVAFNQLQHYEYKYQVQSQIVPESVGKECYNLTGIGARKLYRLVSKPMKREGIWFDRDAFFAHLSKDRLLGCHLLSKIKASDSKYGVVDTRTQFGYCYLAGNMNPGKWYHLRGNQKEYLYLSLVTDAYSRKITDWNYLSLSWSRSRSYHFKKGFHAIAGALPVWSDPSFRPWYPVLFDKYLNKLNATSIHISMTKNGDQLENAIAEPVKGILKSEWLNKRMPETKWETAPL